jgi:hypothetical protein
LANGLSSLLRYSRNQQRTLAMIRIRSLAAVVTLCAIAFLTTTPASAKRHHLTQYQAYQQQQANYYKQFYRQQHTQYGYTYSQSGYDTQPTRRVHRYKYRTKIARSERKKPVELAARQTPDANGSPAKQVTTELSPRRTVPDIISYGEETERTIDLDLKMPDQPMLEGRPDPEVIDAVATAKLQSYKDYSVQKLETGSCRAHTVRIMTAFNIPICVDERFAQKFGYFFAMLKERGCEVKEIVCQSWGHKRGTNHHGGGACDVDQYRRDKTHAECMYHAGDLVKLAGLYDGCWWGNRDCGHVEGVQGLYNYGKTHYAGRSRHRTRYASHHHRRHHRYASR